MNLIFHRSSAMGAHAIREAMWKGSALRGKGNPGPGPRCAHRRTRSAPTPRPPWHRCDPPAAPRPSHVRSARV
ncbi:hypothetical protein Ddc_22399 [Ditylenchus destructor]|nr:hypothetical protein Ddc_22399 [Ditylenchus destructor]